MNLIFDSGAEHLLSSGTRKSRERDEKKILTWEPEAAVYSSSLQAGLARPPCPRPQVKSRLNSTQGIVREAND